MPNIMSTPTHEDPTRSTLPVASGDRMFTLPAKRPYSRKAQSPSSTPQPPGTKLQDIPSTSALKGITPVELMLNAMREFNDEAEEAFELATQLPADSKRRAELQSYGRTMISMAVDVAKDAAPYVHPKLNSTTISGDPDAPLSILSADELKKFVRGGGA